MRKHARRIWGRVDLTDGKLREYERSMQSIPGFELIPKTKRERDCIYCLHWDHKNNRCSWATCIEFQD